MPEARIPLQADGETRPPGWAVGKQPAGTFWYFANEYGEQWVAKRVGSELLVSGLDIGWEEIRMDIEKARLIVGDLATTLSYRVITVGQWILSAAEAMWLVSVIVTAFPEMQSDRYRTSEREQ